MEKSLRVPQAMKAKCEAIWQHTDLFCDQHLNSEYKMLIRAVIAALCRKKTSPLTSGKETSWAAGAVHAVGMVNFLFDPAQTPHCQPRDIYAFFAVGASTGQGKSKQIRDLLKMYPFDPNWTVPSLQTQNPFTWLVQINGFFVDARHLPPVVQAALVEQGMIPYLPEADPDVHGGSVP
ncbi:MAG: hypothetical protein OHK0012_07720 [Synechococcales cyanobacterium]